MNGLKESVCDSECGLYILFSLLFYLFFSWVVDDWGEEEDGLEQGKG